ncbi:MAG: hypothetical protein LBV02_06490 [Bacteroidales bacterium]|jgi:hypothetical protein|nr:hypothetical protein [Bacteroidales bacterium]
MKKKSKTIISSIEMEELKGGFSSSASDDVINKNKVATCRCTWNDNSTTINENKVTGCTCVCMHPIQISQL